MRSSRPLPVTLLAIGVLTLAVAGLVRLSQAIVLWDFLTTLAVSPFYLVITGLIFGVVGLPAAWGLWQGKPWATRFSKVYLLTIFVYFWIDRMYLTKSSVASSNTPFALLMTGLILGFTFWVFQRKTSQDFFTHGDMNDR